VAKYGRQASSAVPRISIVRSKTSSSAATVRARLGLSVRSVNAEPDDPMFQKAKAGSEGRRRDPSPGVVAADPPKEAIASPASDSVTPQAVRLGKPSTHEAIDEDSTPGARRGACVAEPSPLPSLASIGSSAGSGRASILSARSPCATPNSSAAESDDMTPLSSVGRDSLGVASNRSRVRTSFGSLPRSSFGPAPSPSTPQPLVGGLSAWLSSLTEQSSQGSMRLAAYRPGQGWQPAATAKAAPHRRGMLKARLAKAVRSRASVFPPAGAVPLPGMVAPASDSPASVASISSLLSDESPVHRRKAPTKPMEAPLASKIEEEQEEDSDDDEEFHVGVAGLEKAIALVKQQHEEARVSSIKPSVLARVSLMGAGRRSVMVVRRVTRSQTRAMKQTGKGPPAPEAPPMKHRDVQERLAQQQRRRVSMGLGALAEQPRAVRLPGLAEAAALIRGKPPLEMLEEASDEDSEDEDTVMVEQRHGAGLPRHASPEAVSKCLPLVLEWLQASELLSTIPLVSHSWRLAAASAFNWRAAEIGQEDVEGEEEAEDFEDSVRQFLEAKDSEARRQDGVVTLSGIRLSTPLYRQYLPFHQAFPWGAFLSEGAYKRVYAVWSAALRRREAVSVMDVEAIADAGACNVVRSEVRCACLVSELVRVGVCPNFVETYQVFSTSFPPSVELWGDETNRAPRGALNDSVTRWTAETSSWHLPVPENTDLGVFQFARMELCSGGDVEDFLAQIEPVVAASEDSDPAEVDRWYMGAGEETSNAGTLGLMFQLMFALHAARERLSMRHWDIKLLNCLLLPADEARAGRPDSRGVATTVVSGAPTDASSGLSLAYSLGDRHFRVNLPRGTPKGSLGALPGHILKLADFGTADTRSESLGEPLRPRHLTTFENTCPELLLLGDSLGQSYQPDTFATGLCMLHLLTGSCPYEQILESVACPELLAVEIRLAWLTSKPKRANSKVVSFSVLRPALTEYSDDCTLQDTLVRFLVLFGFPGVPGQETCSAVPEHLRAKESTWEADSTCATPATVPAGWSRMSPVWKLLREWLGPARTAATTRKRRGRVPVSDPHATVREWFHEMQAQFNVWTGSHPLMQRARRRMACVPGTAALLWSLTHFDPGRRPDTLTAITQSAAFLPLVRATTPSGFEEVALRAFSN
jgi:serine/threonine protein kinase